MPGKVEHLNPDGLHRNPAYSQAIAVSGNTQDRLRRRPERSRRERRGRRQG